VKAAFLDRDGVINLDTGYVHRWDEFVFAPGAIAAMRDLQTAGFMLIVVTNQAGIARGYYQASDVEALHRWMQDELAAQGIVLSGIYYCPHHPDFGEIRLCRCRKPQSGMLLEAAADLVLDLSQSWIIGDQMTDAAAGLHAGTKAVVIGTQSIDGLKYSLPFEQRLSVIQADRLFMEATIWGAAARILAD
jgi:D-glycero-D-manno-heptose 1,7-bisphosphate phosphatase